ncbi:S-layer homology domain-containing protein [Aetokthonos hydrillicola Thurmond2011]|uniref:S-layer homology domain-containing protein n=1 Tax=Aetokthonos hydrillicola Thurmond2011 TaxID=2712845 RepID=A0AAP5M9L4_9CYAN|nr:S-layer homology domain-containing protein [Aetokthonos hydrillicola]MBO3460836.1 S-layer homology domain-containing protein [Aetokthonos hydrillicola CCALA 1050]MBW4585629.1 S-layer homology domain-containing protein [Aetokthonos hydrillicola CCALA 1050]MDR9894529.1 S-layer homology domain-containing protein [Aetokthonos hydrillicola Thurmond2011]
MFHYKSQSVALVSLTVLLTSLTACSNSQVAKNIEQTLAADPSLKDKPVTFGTQAPNTKQNQPTTQTVQLPSDFPKEIPLYPNATLEEVTPSGGSDSGVSTRWQSSDPSNSITTFYRQQFQANNWQILQQPPDDQQGSFEARRNNLQIKVSIQLKSVPNSTTNQPHTITELVIEHIPNTTPITQTTPTSSPQTTNETVPSQPSTSPSISASPPNDSTTQATPTPPINTVEKENTATPGNQEITDLNKAPQALRQYIQDLVANGILPVDSNAVKSNNATKIQFQPDKILTRQEYARWLVAANNAMYANNPAKQIRLASESSQPAFSDVPKTDPNFPAIQGLAEAGLIPSPLSGNSTAVLFHSNAPLTREQLILWKIPLDTRQALPSANLDTIKQTWGFQDAAKIDPQALRALLADFQNGEKSNIRRVFGYTTLFQPKKAVTRAEAAATLWYFGTLNEGVSAQDALKLKR